MKNLEDIKNRLRKLLKEEVERQSPKNKIAKKSSNIELYLEKIPKLKDAIEKVMTPNYKHFLVDANVISPKPFTIRFKTKNSYHFELFIKDGSFRCKVSGKKYDLNTDGEIEKASESITELLSLGKLEPTFSKSGGGDLDGIGDMGGMKGGGSGGGLLQGDTTGGDEDVFKPIDDVGQQNIGGNEQEDEEEVPKEEES
jgi:hypothetical protein